MTRKTLILAAGLTILPWVAFAQPFDLNTPADSPLWWTLTDEVSSEELRAAYREPGSSQRRYKEAVAAGVEEPRAAEQLEKLKFYLNPQLNPELEAMWSPFHFFADSLRSSEEREDGAAALASYGVSSEGAATVLTISELHVADTERLIEEIGPKHKEFIRMHWEILDRDGWSDENRAAVKRAVKGGDLRYFARQTNRSEEEVVELLAAAKRGPLSEAAARSLPRLKVELSQVDWQGLRRFLIDRAAQSGAFKDF